MSRPLPPPKFPTTSPALHSTHVITLILHLPLTHFILRQESRHNRRYTSGTSTHLPHTTHNQHLSPLSSLPISNPNPNPEKYQHTFSLFVADPSVPVKQPRILLTFVPVMYLLKQALALITALQLSLLTSQTTAKADEAKIARMAMVNEGRILSSWVVKTRREVRFGGKMFGYEERAEIWAKGGSPSTHGMKAVLWHRPASLQSTPLN